MAEVMKEFLNALFARFLYREFVMVTIDGTGCVVTPLEAIEMARNGEAGHIASEFSSIWMTMPEYEALGEFDGW